MTRLLSATAFAGAALAFALPFGAVSSCDGEEVRFTGAELVTYSVPPDDSHTGTLHEDVERTSSVLALVTLLAALLGVALAIVGRAGGGICASVGLFAAQVLAWPCSSRRDGGASLLSVSGSRPVRSPSQRPSTCRTLSGLAGGRALPSGARRRHASRSSSFRRSRSSRSWSCRSPPRSLQAPCGFEPQGAYARRKASTASTRRCSSGAGMRPSFPKIVFTCVSTVFGLRTSCSQIALVREPLGHEGEHLALARRELVERIVARAGGR